MDKADQAKNNTEQPATEEFTLVSERLKQKELEVRQLRERVKSLQDQIKTLQIQLKTFTKLKAGMKRIPLAIPLSRLARGDLNGVKWYFKEQKTDRLIQAEDREVDESELFELFDMDYLDRIGSMLCQLPSGNGCRYYEKHPGKIGWIAEQFRYDALSCAIDGVVLTPDDWEEGIRDIDFLFVTSGWRGVNNAWPDYGKKGSNSRNIIDRVIRTCKDRKIPTVFFSMEDPPNYLIFIDLAKQCDYVFTAAEEVIPDYRKDCGHDRVYLLKASVNPLIHNPVGIRKFERSDKILFAGSWMKKYPERIRDTQMMFDGAIKAGNGLRIIDRNMFRMEKRYYFPKKYAPYVSPPVDHMTLQKIHKLYNWGFTFNSVRNSRTMFANRAYEMLALGNLILSDDCLGVKTQIPTAFICTSEEQTAEILQSMTPEEIYRRQMEGLRYVLREDTSFDRMKTVLETIGLPYAENHRTVVVVIASDNPEEEPVFKTQTYPDKKALTLDEWRMNRDHYDMITFMDPQIPYDETHLEDLINGFKYTDSDYITKDAKGTEHDYISSIPDKMQTVFWADSFSVKDLEDMTDETRFTKGYAIHNRQWVTGDRYA